MILKGMLVYIKYIAQKKYWNVHVFAMCLIIYFFYEEDYFHQTQLKNTQHIRNVTHRKNQNSPKNKQICNRKEKLKSQLKSTKEINIGN